MKKVSVILPTYNEVGSIVPLTTHITRVLTKAGYKHEVIVVDDNSPDGTAEVVRQASAKNKNIRLLVRKENPGLGLSIREGIKASRGEIIIGMDADGNHDPEDLPVILNDLQGETKLVVASRFAGEGGMAGWRMLPTFLFNSMFRLWGLPIWDNTSGYYGVRKKDLESLGIDKIYYGYGDYHLRLVFFAGRALWRIIEVPTRYQARIAGASKSKLFEMGLEYTKEAWRLRYGDK